MSLRIADRIQLIVRSVQLNFSFTTSEPLASSILTAHEKVAPNLFEKRDNAKIERYHQKDAEDDEDSILKKGRVDSVIISLELIKRAKLPGVRGYHFRTNSLTQLPAKLAINTISDGLMQYNNSDIEGKHKKKSIDYSCTS